MCCDYERHPGGRHGRRHDCGPRHRRGRHHGHHGGSCACGQPVHFQRRFWTKEERMAWLEQYLEGLQKEANAVEERIAEMKGA